MKFEWDPQKNQANIAKHHLDFADALFTEPNEETIRIISPRRALPYERTRYEQYLRDELGES